MLWSRSAAIRNIYFDPGPRRRALMAVVVVFSCFPLSALAYPVFGPPTIALDLIGIAAVGGLLGMRVGIASAVVLALASLQMLRMLGDPRWQSPTVLTALPVVLAAIVVALVAGRLHDVGSWLRTEQLSLADAEERQRAIIDNLPVIIQAIDMDGRIQLHAGAGLKTIGKPPAPVGESVYDRYDGMDELTYFERARAGEQVSALIARDGYEFEARYAPLRHPDGSVRGVVAVGLDQTERRVTQRAIEHLRTHDAATGFANRDAFVARLDERLHAAGSPFSVLSVVVDNVGDVNEGLGHDMGDRLLREIAERLQTRQLLDVARVESSEFAAIATGEVSEATRAAREIATGLEAPIQVNAVLVQASAFVGIAPASSHQSGAALLREATVAVELARRGGTSYAVYSVSQDLHRAGGIALAGELHAALENDRLSLVYQPIVDIATGRVIAVEALARWLHPQRGSVPPIDFIPVAERTGLIRPMTRWVLRRALTDARSLLEARAIQLSVNLSMRNLQDEDLPATVYALLKDCDGGAPQLRFEVTESAIMADTQRAVSVLTRLRDMGARIAVDDFGTGYSSLAYLQRLPVDTVKIDRSFVRDLPRDGARRAIVRAIVEMSHALELRVVAEGVEDEETWRILADTGCDHAQGYLIARPMTLESLRAFLDEPRLERA